jgi:hypothetical protein
MRRLFILLLLSISASLYSQVKTLSEVVKENEVETERQRRKSISVESLQKIEHTLNLEPLADNNNDYSFRLSFNYSAITIYKNGDDTFGDIIIVAKNEDEYHTKDQLFRLKVALTKDQAQKALALIDSTAIDTIPSKEYIVGWGQGFDGISYALQQKKSDIHGIKTYWSPKIFPELPQAVAIEQFKSELLSIIGYRNVYETFQRIIPFDAYSMGGAWVAGKILPYKEYMKKKREARRKKRQK